MLICEGGLIVDRILDHLYQRKLAISTKHKEEATALFNKRENNLSYYSRALLFIVFNLPMVPSEKVKEEIARLQNTIKTEITIVPPVTVAPVTTPSPESIVSKMKNCAKIPEKLQEIVEELFKFPDPVDYLIQVTKQGS
jgi:hypothetical protein